MADIIFNYVEMRKAAADIQNIAAKYKTAGVTFETDFLAAITGWEGDSKTQMEKFIKGSVNEYTQKTVPQLLEALAALLNANADQMEKADNQIAQNIPG